MYKAISKLLVCCIMILVLLFALSACNKEEKNNFEVKFYDSDWSELESIDLYQELIYNGEEHVPYNAIAFNNGVEFARIDFSDHSTFSSTNPFKVSINSCVYHGVLPKEVGYYDINYIFWYDRNTPKDLPNATGYIGNNRYTLVIDYAFDYSIKLFDDEDAELLEDEYTFTYTGEPILPAAKVFLGDNQILEYTYDGGFADNYLSKYTLYFWINDTSLVFDPKTNKNTPKEPGTYSVSYMLYIRYQNLNDYKRTFYTRKVIINIVEDAE